MKKIILTTLLCLPIVVFAQSTTEEKEPVNDKTTNTSIFYTAKQQGFSNDRFKAEIPYVDTSNLKHISFDMIVENVNMDQIALPTEEQVHLTTDLKLVKLTRRNMCGSTFKIGVILPKKD